MHQQHLIIYLPIRSFENKKENFEYVKVCTCLGRLDADTIYETLRVIRTYVQLETF